MASPHALRAGTVLKDYWIEDILGSGGFGITYRARDRRLDTTVAIKEYFPVQLAVRHGDQTVASRSDGSNQGLYAWGLDKFRTEADTLAKLQHANIVGVNYLFQANNTSYMVLDFVDGGSMKDWLKRIKRLPEQPELDTLLFPLMSALEAMHAKGLLHRDIAPKNIMLAKPFRPVLIDFGAVRMQVAQHSQTVANMLTPGYAPCEQYSNKGQGPWTDIYALAATFYDAITGSPPPDGLERIVDDRYKPAAIAGRGRYHPRFLEAVDVGLRPMPKDRPQTIAEWRQMMDWSPAPADAAAAAATMLNHPGAAPNTGSGSTQGRTTPTRSSWLGGWFGRG